MSTLFGRLQECATLDAAVARARTGEGGSLIVIGGPGAGKSALLDYVMNSPGDAGTIHIEGLESEAEIGLAGLHRLLLFHPEHRSVLPPAQRRALDASLGLSGPAEAAPFLLGLAVLTLLNDLSRSRPLICLIDDAHWLDPESAQVLAFVARRLQNERILMVFAARDQPETSVFSGIPELAVRALGLDDAVEVLLSAAGDIPLDRQVARDIADRAEGNPLALIEVGHELAARRTPPSALLDEPLPVGYRLRRHYESQIRRVPEDTRQLLLLAAANLGSAPGTLWRATELAGLDPDAARPAERGQLIDLSPDMSAEALPAIVEAGLRSGHANEAAAALADLESCATASGTGWALGLLARSRALMAPSDQAGQLYQESIDILGRTTATADLARAHLLFGEWLRRNQRPADARGHLQTALSLFTSMGAIPFARRARSELQAAGASPDAPQTPNSPLTARESQIASMAAVGYANQEIADRLFITTHTVEYHLKKVFRKLGIVSRRQLRDKVSSETN